jgi:hypothetical protein
VNFDEVQMALCKASISHCRRVVVLHCTKDACSGWEHDVKMNIQEKEWAGME